MCVHVHIHIFIYLCVKREKDKGGIAIQKIKILTKQFIVITMHRIEEIKQHTAQSVQFTFHYFAHYNNILPQHKVGTHIFWPLTAHCWIPFSLNSRSTEHGLLLVTLT